MKSLVEFILESGHAYKKLKIQKFEQGLKELGDKNKYARDTMLKTFDMLADYNGDGEYENVKFADVIDLFKGSKFKRTLLTDMEQGLSFIVNDPSDDIVKLLSNKDGIEMKNWDEELGGLFIRLDKTSNEYLLSIFDIILG